MANAQPFRIYNARTLGEALAHYRHIAGLTQEDLATRTGLNRTYLSELERGKDTEQLRRLFRVFRELGLRLTAEEADW